MTKLTTTGNNKFVTGDTDSNALVKDDYDANWQAADNALTALQENPDGGGGSVATPTAVITTSGTSLANTFEQLDTTSGAITRTLPTTPTANAVFVAKLVTYGVGNNVTIACGGSAVFNKTGGPTAMTLSIPNQAISLQYKVSGDIWLVSATDIPPRTRRTITTGNTAGWNEKIEADTTSAAFSLTLPAPTNTIGDLVITNTGTNVLTLTGTVSGQVNPKLLAGDSCTINSKADATALYFS